MFVYEYATKYNFDAANDILRCVIQGYKKEKQIRIIAKDVSDGVEYWYRRHSIISPPSGLGL